MRLSSTHRSPSLFRTALSVTRHGGSTAASGSAAGILKKPA
jgi:hypothetical protein